MKFITIILLVAISFLPLISLFHLGIPITHDGQDHVARIANFYTNLEQGNIIPRWAPNLNWGYGHPILMFLYPLPSYVASFFHFLGFSLIDSTKLVFILSYIVSGLTMFLWIKEFLGKNAGFVAAVLYLFVPYRFVDLYVRGAIGEHVAFIFLPLIFYFFIKLSKKYTKFHFLGGVIAISLLLLSHNAISLMFFPILFFYIIFLTLSVSKKKEFLLMSFIVILLGFLLASFFWLPAFIEGKYTLRDIVTSGEYVNRFVKFDDLLYGQWSFGGSGQFSVQVGIPHWIVVIMSIFIFIFLRRKVKQKTLLLGFILIFFFSLLIMLDTSSFLWKKVTTLQKFQFPWRFLTISVFASAVLGGFVVSLVSKKYVTQIVIVTTCALLFLTHTYWGVNGYFSKPDSFFTDVYYGTTDTGESAPIWSVRFMEKAPKAKIEVIQGSADITSLERKVNVHTYAITAKTQVRIRENTLYFPGWNVLIDNKKLSENNVEYQDPANRGLITFFVPEGGHTVSILFTETKLRLIADIISLSTFGFLLFYAILKKRPIWQRFLSY